MGSTNSRKAKPAMCEPPRRLTPSEIASLRQEMKEASDWMSAEIQRRHEMRKTALKQTALAGEPGSRNK